MFITKSLEIKILSSDRTRQMKEMLTLPKKIFFLRITFQILSATNEQKGKVSTRHHKNGKIETAIEHAEKTC